MKGRCFDIGNATRARSAIHATHEPFCGDPGAAGNGSLMRLAPAPLAFANDPTEAIRLAGDSSRTTHAAVECIDACRYFAGLILAALSGMPKRDILNNEYELAVKCWLAQPLAPKVEEIARGSFQVKEPPAIRGSGYVIHTLEAALWAFHTTDDFRAGALAVVNLGEDADTTGAVFGQIAGAYYGVDGIPGEWREKLAMRELIEQRAAELHAMSSGKQE